MLLYGCTIWTLTNRMKKKLDGIYKRMLQAILNKSWKQHPTKQQLYDHLPSITKTIKIRRTRHAWHCWRSRDELVRYVFLKTCRKQWTIGRGGERGSGISVLMAWHDDDDKNYDVNTQKKLFENVHFVFKKSKKNFYTVFFFSSGVLQRIFFFWLIQKQISLDAIYLHFIHLKNLLWIFCRTFCLRRNICN